MWPAAIQSMMSPFSGRPGSSTVQTRAPTRRSSWNALRSCSRPAASLSGRITTLRPARVFAWCGRNLPDPMQLQVAVNPHARSASAFLSPSTR